MTYRKCYNCLYYTDKPNVSIKLMPKPNYKFELIRSENCPVCQCLMFGSSKEVQI